MHRYILITKIFFLTHQLYCKISLPCKTLSNSSKAARYSRDKNGRKCLDNDQVIKLLSALQEYFGKKSVNLHNYYL